MKFRVGHAYELGVSNTEIARFYRQQWARETVLGLPTFVHWLFCTGPEANGRNHSFVAVAPDGQLLGILGATPRKFIRSSNSVTAAELFTWVTDSDSRGLGLGSELLSFAKSRFDVLLGGGISSQALPLYLGAGFQWIQHLPRYFRIYDSDQASKIMSIDKLGLREIRASQIIKQTSSYVSEKVSPQEIAKLALKSLCAYSRDESFLSWRYSSHPYFNYEAAIIRNNDEQEAGVVLRQFQIDGMQFAHCLELVGNQPALSSVASFIDDWARLNRVIGVDFTCTNSTIGAHLRSCGWFSTLDAPYLPYPNLFYPIEFRSPATTSLAIWSRSSLSSVIDPALFYFTKGDLDLDTPTIPFLRLNGMTIDQGTYPA